MRLCAVRPRSDSWTLRFLLALSVACLAAGTLAAQPPAEADPPVPAALLGDPTAAKTLTDAGVWILPQPKRATRLAGEFDLSKCRGIRSQGIEGPEASAAVERFAARLKDRSGVALKPQAGQPEKGWISFTILPSKAEPNALPAGLKAADWREVAEKGGYLLAVDTDQIVLIAPGNEALALGQQTLLQMATDRTTLPALTIVDWPSLRFRGLMQDISRGQVPQPATLQRLAAVLAEAKMNVLEMYIEHVFKFPSHSDISPPEGLTPEECRQLADIGAKQGIAVYPMFQVLGHSHFILGKPPYQHLAFPFSGKPNATVTWDIRKPEAVAMMQELVDDLCRAMPGTKFTVDITEIDYDALLAAGNTPEQVVEIVYQYVLKLREMVARHGKRLIIAQGPLDSIGHLAGLGPKLEQLPKDIFVGSYYCAGGPYMPAWKKDFPRMQAAGLEFFAQPWIDSHIRIFPWVGHAGKFSDDEIRRGLAFGAAGSTTCDWGDEGHFHLVGQEWYPVLYHGASAWTGAQVDRAYFDRAFTQILYGVADDSVARAITLVGNIHNQKVNRRDAQGQVVEIPFDLFWEFFVDPFGDPKIVALAEPTETGKAILAPAEEALRLLEAARPRATRNQDNLEQVAFAARVFAAMGRKLVMVGHARDLNYPPAQLKAELEELVRTYQALKADFERLWLAEDRDNENFRQFVARFDQTIVPCQKKLTELASVVPSWTLPKASDVELGGPLGEAYRRGVARLGEDPYKSVVYLRSDLSFEVTRPFTNFSGDISGRFLEAASMTSPPGKMEPAALAGLIESVPKYQLADGHFGREIDWSKPIDDAPLCLTDKSIRLPAFWGHSRLLVGLLEAYETYRDAKLLTAARRLGDFYVNTAGLYLDPAREELYRSTGSFAAAYVTCYFPALEGLVRLAQATGDDRYLRHAERMADFFTRFDKLPLDHSHGNLIAYHGLLLLHEVTGKQEYLDRALARWQEALEGGYIWPIGGVGEFFNKTSHHDEGCSEADWLRMNLDLWRITGQTRFLDTAERLLVNHYAMNRMANGGYGHHVFVSDADGPAFMKAEQIEAVWCCTFHGLVGMTTLKRYVVAGSSRGIFVNFPLDVTAPVQVGPAVWNVTVRRQTGTDQTVGCQVQVDAREGTSEAPKVFVRQPAWAERAEVKDAQGKVVDVACQSGYLEIPMRPGAEGAVTVSFAFAPRVENRRMQPQTLETAQVARYPGVVLCNGPAVLLANADQPRPVVVLSVDPQGRLVLPKAEGGRYRVNTVAKLDASEEEIQSALKSPGALELSPWEGIHRDRGAAFVFDLIVVRQQ